MAFESNAIAIQLDDRHAKTDIPGGKVDAVIVDFGRGTARALKHTQHMESAQAAGQIEFGVTVFPPLPAGSVGLAGAVGQVRAGNVPIRERDIYGIIQNAL